MQKTKASSFFFNNLILYKNVSKSDPLFWENISEMLYFCGCLQVALHSSVAC